MAWFKTGGGSQELVETVLWTNPSPTSSFATQAVTLSEGVSNFDYIKIDWVASTTDISQRMSVIIKSSDYPTINRAYPGLSSDNSGGTTAYSRLVNDHSDTELGFGSAFRIGGSGTTNTQSIPISVTGLKYATPKPSGTETTLWTNSSPTSSFAGQTITLSEIFTNFRYLKIVGRLSTSDSTETVAIYPVDFVKRWNQGTPDGRGALNVAISGSNYMRNIYIATADIGTYIKLSFDNALKVGATTSANTNVIPTQIIGIS